MAYDRGCPRCGGRLVVHDVTCTVDPDKDEVYRLPCIVLDGVRKTNREGVPYSSEYDYDWSDKAQCDCLDCTWEGNWKDAVSGRDPQREYEREEKARFLSER